MPGLTTCSRCGYLITTADVLLLQRFAAKNNLTISVKGTGHDYNGRCSSDGSLNINTRLLNDVFFDVRQNKVRN